MQRKIKKVLLFVPPVFTFKDNLDVNPLPPLGLGYIGAVLENNGIEVKIIDCIMEGWHKRVDVRENIIRIGLSFKKIEDVIRNYCPDIIGVNNLFTVQRKNAHEIYKIAKKVDKNIITIAGGGHPTVMPELVLRDENVDYVVIGEGEDTIIDLIAVIEGRKDVSDLDGVGYKRGNKIEIIPKTKFIIDLDTIPFPARHLLNMEKYFGLHASHGIRKRKRFSPIITSRGCPARCTFCSAYKAWGRRYRFRSPENVILEMKQIKERYGIEELMFEDDNLTANPKRAEKIFDLMIQEKLNFIWDTPNGIAVFSLNERLIDKIKKSGCYKINLALESGSQYVLENIIKKPVKLDKAKALVRYARSIGLDVGLFFIIGLPGETKSQIMETFDLAKVLKIYDPWVSVATPYPGTELYKLCLEKGYLGDKFSLDDLFIRGFSISTEYWDGKELRELLENGYMYLRLAKYKKNPFMAFVKVLSSFIRNPARFIKKIFKFIKFLKEKI
jgi:magnesium-protoporphyrin IX monomethyl ester (oxidative) cyclase